MIDILFFGRVADKVGQRRMAMALPPEGLSLLALRTQLFGHVGAEDADTPPLHMSVNQALVSDDRPLHDGDEVAFFSVFSGG